MSHRWAGFIGDPTGQLKASANAGSWESGPTTLKREGEWGLALTCRLRASRVYTWQQGERTQEHAEKVSMKLGHIPWCTT